MKKTTSLNVCTGPGCSYSFLHLTLQEYLTALHIAIVNPSGFELVEWLNESVVVRFLAGMCRHGDYHSHPVYQELVQLLASNWRGRLLLVHCAYECPSIMDSVKVDYSKHYTIQAHPSVGFDWYTTGYCISHFDERWELRIDDKTVEMETIDLLVKGLRSSPIAKGRIRFLILSLQSLSFSRVITPLREFSELRHLILKHYDHNDEIILQQLIAPGSGLRRLEYKGELHTNTLIPLLFQPSSLQELTLDIGYQEYVPHELLPHKNSNLKKLTMSRGLLHPLAALFMNNITYLAITSTSFLFSSDLPVLTNIVQSHHTLEELQIGDIIIDFCSDYSTNLLQLIEAAGNSRLKKLRLYKRDYDELPSHIQEQYKHLLI